MSRQFNENRRRENYHQDIEPSNQRGLYDIITNSWVGLVFLAFTPIDVEQIDALIYLKRIITGPNRPNQVRKFAINLLWFIDDIITLFATAGVGNFIPIADKETIRLGKKVLPKSVVRKFSHVYDKIPDWLKEDVKKEAKGTGQDFINETGQNKWEENGRTVMADEERDNRRTNSRGSAMRGSNRNTSWSDIEPDNSDEGFSFNMNGLPIPGSTIVKILGAGLIGILIFAVGSAVLGGGGGVFGAFFDYGAANVDGPDFEEVGFMTSSALKTVTCFGDLGCYREWQLNNTRRPGSQDVGETYKLNIKNFQVYGTGNGVDVAYSNPSDSIPIYFLVQNVRNGLKGIDARNVKYRVRVRDEGLLSSRNYCKTDWIELNTNYGQEDDSNILIPGAAAEPLEWKDQLSLRECGLLQPGPGNFVNFVLEIKYDYSSKSTLYVDAMSQEHRRSQQIPIDFKRSETADTPVETYIETRSPILFAGSGNDRTPMPFTTRVGVHTDSRDVDYTIETSAFKFQDSSITEEVENSCQGLTRSSDKENTYRLSDEMITRIQERQTADENGPGKWFNYQSQPTPASCTMKLSDEGDGISRTGETLTMSADVNYTVKLEEKEKSFKIFNSRCATLNCPMLVPLRGENISSSVINTDLNKDNPSYTENPEYWTKTYSYCRGNQDGQNGCSVIESFELADKGTPLPLGNPTTIEEGEIAIDMTDAVNVQSMSNFVTCRVKNNLELGKNGVSSIAGIDENRLKAATEPSHAIGYSDGWEVERLDENEPKLSNGCVAQSSDTCYGVDRQRIDCNPNQ